MRDRIMALLGALTLAISLFGLSSCHEEEPAPEPTRAYRTTLYDVQGDIIGSWATTKSTHSDTGLIVTTVDGKEVYMDGGIVLIEEL